MTAKTRQKTRSRRVRSGTVPAVTTLANQIRKAMAARGYVLQRAGQGQNRLDEVMGKKQGFTAGLLGRTKDPRMSNVVLMAKTLRVRLEWLVLGTGDMELEGAAGGETFGMLPGWDVAARSVRGVPGYAIDAVSRRPVIVRPASVTPEFVRAVAGFWLSWAPPAEVEEAERRAIEQLKIKEDEDGRSGAG